jgi:hydroxyacylglutathione hydrolase
MIIEQLLVTDYSVFCYLIADESTRDAVLIDPAGDFEKIMNAVQKHKSNVKWIINTHGHFDHTNGNDHMMKKLGVPLLIHEKDLPFLKGVSRGMVAKFTGTNILQKPVHTLSDGDIIKLGSSELKVIHTPGHSQGCICLYTNGNLFTGDTLFTEGMGRTDFDGGSEKLIMDSIKNKILKYSDKTVIWPGHHYGRYPKSTVSEQKAFYGQS